MKKKLIAGVDEAGRGPLAGPVVAAACVFEEGFSHELITDSKKLSAKKRELLFEEIIILAKSYSIIAVGPRRIENINIREATKVAMSLAVKRINADLVLIDGNMAINTDLHQKQIIKGDLKHQEIGAASILAKVYRDRIMKKLDQHYPGYYLSKHSGYPTKLHMERISILGPSKIHRKTFKGVKEYL
ncbi:UNVERIFIED_CONTAM: hypothetical protein GTU68_001746 [Idotea baltica]|nr:hypothetical protein [Idotea baltica]